MLSKSDHLLARDVIEGAFRRRCSAGDYVDRGQHSLEVVCLLFALKVENPKHVHLLRGNHEDASMNCMFGFMAECCQRLGREIGARCWTSVNSVFNYLPVGAIIADKILCIHGGIGQASPLLFIVMQYCIASLLAACSCQVCLFVARCSLLLRQVLGRVAAAHLSSTFLSL